MLLSFFISQDKWISAKNDYSYLEPRRLDLFSYALCLQMLVGLLLARPNSVIALGVPDGQSSKLRETRLHSRPDHRAGV